MHFDLDHPAILFFAAVGSAAVREDLPFTIFDEESLFLREDWRKGEASSDDEWLWLEEEDNGKRKVRQRDLFPQL